MYFLYEKKIVFDQFNIPFFHNKNAKIIHLNPFISMKLEDNLQQTDEIFVKCWFFATIC